MTVFSISERSGKMLGLSLSLCCRRGQDISYIKFGFDELEDDMLLAPEKDELCCLPMYLSLDWEE